MAREPGRMSSASRPWGVPAYLDQQLHPERIDDPACDRAIARLETLGLSAPDLTTAYFAGLIRDFIAKQQAGQGERVRRCSSCATGSTLRRSKKADAAPAPVPKTPAEMLADAPKLDLRPGVGRIADRQGRALPSRANGNSRKCWSISGAIISTSTPGRRWLPHGDGRGRSRGHPSPSAWEVSPSPGRFGEKSPAMLTYLPDNKRITPAAGDLGL